MNKIIGVTDFQRNFKKTFDEVAEDHVPYILTRGSRPEVALIPYDLFVKCVRADEDGVLRRFDEILARMAEANSPFAEDEVDRDIRSARRAVRSAKKR
jgi:prevent-host-death family protein